MWCTQVVVALARRNARVMQREKLSIEDIDAILHHEMTQRLGYDAKDHMMRVNYLAADGQPNWNANFASESPAPLPVLNAFIEALAAMISFITCQSSMLRLPGSCCSPVTLTSFGISRAQVAKNTAGLVLAVLTIVSRPSSKVSDSSENN